MEGYVRPYARDCCAAVLPFAYGQSLPASRTVLRPLRPMTVRARVPCMHSDLVTRVERSANNHPDRPGVFARDVMRVITDTPPVADERTLDDEERVRLAQLEYVRAREQAKARERKAVNKRKAKLKALHEQMLKLTEVMYLCHRLLILFAQPLDYAELDAALVQPMVATIDNMVHNTIPDVMITRWHPKPERSPRRMALEQRSLNAHSMRPPPVACGAC